MKVLISCFAFVAWFGVVANAFAPFHRAAFPQCSIPTTSFYSPRKCGVLMAESSLGDSVQEFEREQSPYIAEEQGTRLDVNAIVNNAILFGVAALVLAKVALIDSDVSRGWTTAEVAHHIPISVWQSYMGVLNDSPVSTKAITSATVYTIGDVIAQQAEGASIGEIDRMRILRSMTAGLVAHGPLSHVWYNWSENLFEHLHWTAWWSIAPKVAVDQAFWGPFWNNTYILLLGLMKGESLGQIWEDVKRTTIPLVVSGLKLWPLAHCVTYGLIPVENRLLWVDLVEIIWVTILATSAAGAHGLPTSEHAETAPVPIADDQDPAYVTQ